MGTRTEARIGMGRVQEQELERELEWGRKRALEWE